MHEQEIIDVAIEGIGSASGYVTSNPRLHIANWLASVGINFDDFLKKMSQDVRDLFLSSHCPCAALKNIQVDEEFRGQGYGSELMSDFIAESSGAFLMFLELDQEEIQLDGFDLRDWYEGFGFESVGDTNIMIFDLR